jgi:hypothetical protein
VEILAILLFAILLWATIGRGFVSGLKGNDSAPSSRKQIRLDQVYRWPDIGNYEFEIVGESNYQQALQSLAGNHGDESPEKECTALIAPEDNNPHDGAAVRIDIDNMTVGYLSRADARSFRRRLGAKKMSGNHTCCGAIIVGGFRMKNGLKASYGVKLDIKPFDN